MDTSTIALEAAKVEGFMCETDLAWLADQASRVQTVVELGSWKGRSTVALSATPGVVVAVDKWDGILDGKMVDPDVMVKFLKNTEGFDNIRPLQADIRAINRAYISDLFGDIGMVFVDADHTEDGVRSDIKTAYELLQGRGLICGHDYQFVRGSVEELVPGHQVVAGGDIWYKILGDRRTNVSTVEVVVKCDLCGTRVKGDNTDSWAAKLPLKSKPPQKGEYTITRVDVCFPCKDALGDWVKDRIKG